MTDATRVSTTGLPGQIDQTARRLALGAIAGPVLLALGWIVLGLLQPATKIGRRRKRRPEPELSRRSQKRKFEKCPRHPAIVCRTI